MNVQRLSFYDFYDVFAHFFLEGNKTMIFWGNDFVFSEFADIKNGCHKVIGIFTD